MILRQLRIRRGDGLQLFHYARQIAPRNHGVQFVFAQDPYRPGCRYMPNW